LRFAPRSVIFFGQIMAELLLDTSTDLCIIALVVEGQIQLEHVFAHTNQLAQNLLPAIQGVMEKSSLPLSALSSIALGIGPGSYTGTRVGAAVAKSLAFGLGILVRPFYSPLAFLPEREGSFAFLIPTSAGPYFLLKEGSTSLVQKTELEAEVSGVDYLVMSTAHTLPDCLEGKLCFKAAPNLTRLLKFLSQVKPLPPEGIELQYLHTPF
jgi:tRNA A37 threonylcarbamoyladenosine modification protein TsaB